MAKKAAEAFRTISEVSEWLEEPGHVLRFWESKFSQVKPVKRAGGRRYYRPSDMELLGGIKVLLHERGLTIKNVQQILKDEGIKHVQSLSPELAFETSRRKRKTTAKPAKEEKPQIEPPKSTPLTGSDRVERDLHAHIAKGKVTIQKSPAVAPAPATPRQDSASAAIAAAVAQHKSSEGSAPVHLRTLNITKSASLMTADEISEVEDLYFRLKKIRNRMKRAHQSL